MTAQGLAIIIKDVLEEYCILEHSPLQEVKWIKLCDEKNIRFLNPNILIQLRDKSEFHINVTKHK